MPSTDLRALFEGGELHSFKVFSLLFFLVGWEGFFSFLFEFFF